MDLKKHTIYAKIDQNLAQIGQIQSKWPKLMPTLTQNRTKNRSETDKIVQILTKMSQNLALKITK